LEEFYVEAKRFTELFQFQANETISKIFYLNNYLRGGSPYFLSVGFYPLNANFNASLSDITVSLTYDNAVCKKNYLWDSVLEKCELASALRYNNTLKPNSTEYYYEVSSLGNQALGLFFKVSTPSSAEYDNTTYVLYVKRGALPTIDTYDLLFNLSINAEEIEQYIFPGPIPGSYYFLLQNSFNHDLTLLMNVTSTICSNQTMVGPNCNQRVNDLTNQVNVTQFNGTGEYQYFLVNKTELLVGIGLKYANSTAPSIFASFLNVPTEANYVVMSGGNDVNFISSSIYDLKYDHYNYWLVSVWAKENQTYYLWANSNCPNNCSGNATNSSPTGSCNTTSGVCTCDSTIYTGLWCFPVENTKHKLKAVWIVLIVLACVIILAIAIGVPVACYVKNRRRARYERV